MGPNADKMRRSRARCWSNTVQYLFSDLFIHHHLHGKAAKLPGVYRLRYVSPPLISAREGTRAVDCLPER
jgi:hypothetical protein